MFTARSRLLWWDGQHGLAYFDGVHAELRTAPHLADHPVIEIDYAPAVRKRQVRMHADAGWRDMHDAEALAVDAMLGRMVNAVQAAFS